jgi:hypothetical protein
MTTVTQEPASQPWPATSDALLAATGRIEQTGAALVAVRERLLTIEQDAGPLAPWLEQDALRDLAGAELADQQTRLAHAEAREALYREQLAAFNAADKPLVDELRSALEAAARVEQRRDDLRRTFEATTGRQVSSDAGRWPELTGTRDDGSRLGRWLQWARAERGLQDGAVTPVRARK